MLIQKHWYHHKLKHQLFYNIETISEDRRQYIPKFAITNNSIATNNYIIGPPKSGRTEIVKDIIKKNYINQDIIIFGITEKRNDYQDLIDIITKSKTNNIISYMEVNQFNIENLIRDTYDFLINLNQIQKINKQTILIFDDVIQDNILQLFYQYYITGTQHGISTFVISSQIFAFDNTFRLYTNYVYFHRFFLQEPRLNPILFENIYFTSEYIKIQNTVNFYKLKPRKNLFLVANNNPIDLYSTKTLSWILPDRNIV